MKFFLNVQQAAHKDKKEGDPPHFAVCMKQRAFAAANRASCSIKTVLLHVLPNVALIWFQEIHITGAESTKSACLITASRKTGEIQDQIFQSLLIRNRAALPRNIFRLPQK
jgi:hypothetical protein